MNTIGPMFISHIHISKTRYTHAWTEVFFYISGQALCRTITKLQLSIQDYSFLCKYIPMPIVSGQTYTVGYCVKVTGGRLMPQSPKIFKGLTTRLDGIFNRWPFLLRGNNMWLSQISIWLKKSQRCFGSSLVMDFDGFRYRYWRMRELSIKAQGVALIDTDIWC